MKKYSEFTLDEIKECLTDLQLQILDLYLQRTKQKDIVQQIGCTRGQIDSIVKKFALTRFRSRNNYGIDENILNIDNPQFCYFLGWFAADGNLHTTNSGSQIIQFTLAEKEPLELLKSILKYTGEVKTYLKKYMTNFKNKENYLVQTNYYFLGITNKKLVETINTIFGMDMHNKTHILSFPTFNNDECLKMFLRGFWDGDGCFTLNSSNNVTSAVAHCASIEFCKSFCEIMKNNAIEAAFYDLQPCPEIRIYRKEEYKKFVHWLYSVYPDICLERKKIKAYNLLEH